jgi:hypothetical protein
MIRSSSGENRRLESRTLQRLRVLAFLIGHLLEAVKRLPHAAARGRRQMVRLQNHPSHFGPLLGSEFREIVQPPELRCLRLLRQAVEPFQFCGRSPAPVRSAVSRERARALRDSCGTGARRCSQDSPGARRLWESVAAWALHPWRRAALAGFGRRGVFRPLRLAAIAHPYHQQQNAADLENAIHGSYILGPALSGTR